jgi:hypothetical protein
VRRSEANIPHWGYSCLGIDFGLAMLIATSAETTFGRGLLPDLVRYDQQRVVNTRHRSRCGDRPRNAARSRGPVTRLRGLLKTGINAALNRVVTLRAPADLAIERLDFCSVDLSPRMNRLVQSCSRAVFRASADLRERFGIVVTEVFCATARGSARTVTTSTDATSVAIRIPLPVLRQWCTLT